MVETILGTRLMNFTGVFPGSKSELAKIAAAKATQLTATRQACGKHLNAYVLAGVRSD
jgi:adenine deaminase